MAPVDLPFDWLVKCDVSDDEPEEEHEGGNGRKNTQKQNSDK